MTLKSGSEIIQTIKLVPFESLGAVSYSPSIVTMVPSCIICEIKRARYWSKIVIVHTSLHSTSPLGGSPSEYCHPVWCGKTRMVWLPDSEIILRICLAVSTEYRRETDRQADGQTSCHGIVRAMHTRRAGKTSSAACMAYIYPRTRENNSICFPSTQVYH